MPRRTVRACVSSQSLSVCVCVCVSASVCVGGGGGAGGTINNLLLYYDWNVLLNLTKTTQSPPGKLGRILGVVLPIASVEKLMN